MSPVDAWRRDYVRVTDPGQVVDLQPGGRVYLPNALGHSIDVLAPSRITLTPVGIGA